MGTDISPHHAEEGLESAVTLQAIRGVITQELGKIKAEVRGMRDDVRKALGEMEKKVDEKLSKVVKKSEGFELELRTY